MMVMRTEQDEEGGREGERERRERWRGKERGRGKTPHRRLRWLSGHAGSQSSYPSRVDPGSCGLCPRSPTLPSSQEKAEDSPKDIGCEWGMREAVVTEQRMFNVPRLKEKGERTGPRSTNLAGIDVGDELCFALGRVGSLSQENDPRLESFIEPQQTQR